MARRLRGRVKHDPFYEAVTRVRWLEHGAIEKLVTPTFTVDELLVALYGDEIVGKLKAAWPYVRAADQSTNAFEEFMFSGPNHHLNTCVLTIHVRDVKMLVPESSDWVRRDAIYDWQPLATVLNKVAEQHLQFAKLEHAIRWLTAHATPGFAKHYCPWIAGLLPADHPIQTMDGNSFKDPKVGAGSMLAVFRECADIMARALLIGPRDFSTEKRALRISFRGKQTTYDEFNNYQPDITDYSSQTFSVL